MNSAGTAVTGTAVCRCHIGLCRCHIEQREIEPALSHRISGRSNFSQSHPSNGRSNHSLSHQAADQSNHPLSRQAADQSNHPLSHRAQFDHRVGRCQRICKHTDAIVREPYICSQTAPPEDSRHEARERRVTEHVRHRPCASAGVSVIRHRGRAAGRCSSDRPERSDGDMQSIQSVLLQRRQKPVHLGHLWRYRSVSVTSGCFVGCLCMTEATNSCSVASLQEKYGM